MLVKDKYFYIDHLTIELHICTFTELHELHFNIMQFPCSNHGRAWSRGKVAVARLGLLAK